MAAGTKRKRTSKTARTSTTVSKTARKAKKTADEALTAAAKAARKAKKKVGKAAGSAARTARSAMKKATAPVRRKTAKKAKPRRSTGSGIVKRLKDAISHIPIVGNVVDTKS